MDAGTRNGYECTSTMNIDYSSRRARNPVTGKNELVDGNMTYEKRINSLSPDGYHNGKIYAYTANEKIKENLHSAYIARFVQQGYSEADAQIEAIKKMKESYEIDFWEVE